jgi:hypothetical protein
VGAPYAPPPLAFFVVSSPPFAWGAPPPAAASCSACSRDRVTIPQNGEDLTSKLTIRRAGAGEIIEPKKRWSVGRIRYPAVPLEGVAQLGVDLVLLEVVDGEVEVLAGLLLTLTFPSRLILVVSSSSTASPVLHGADDSSSDPSAPAPSSPPLSPFRAVREILAAARDRDLGLFVKFDGVELAYELNLRT